jgi:hypothetical protein
MHIQHMLGSESLRVTSQVAILSSWKEIASYMSQSVRTVQRWEWYLGMPVHRPHGETKGRDIAFPEELDQWLAAAPRRRQEYAAMVAQISELRAKIARLEAENKKLRALVDKKQLGSDLAA